MTIQQRIVDARFHLVVAFLVEQARIAGLVGAVIGGLASFGGTWYNAQSVSKAAEQSQAALVSATALLMQDDFYHFQVTLARALDRWGWWEQSEVLPQQSSVADRKTVWAALPDSPIEIESRTLEYVKNSGAFQAPDTVTNAVADAQGWIDYLTQLRKATDGDPLPSDFDTIKWCFALLDVGRQSLQRLAKREATDFSKSHVFESLRFHSVAELLACTSKPPAG